MVFLLRFATAAGAPTAASRAHCVKAGKEDAGGGERVGGGAEAAEEAAA